MASEQFPPQTYTFLAITIAVVPAVAIGKFGSFDESRVDGFCSRCAVWKIWRIKYVAT